MPFAPELERRYDELQSLWRNQRVASFALTDKCNIRCRICSRDCEAVENMMPEYLWKKLCDDMAFQGYALCIAGGEPTLYPELTARIARYAKERGIYTIVQTNGWWGTHQPTIRAILDGMYVDAVNISVDKYHQEFIPRSIPTKLVEECFRRNITALYETIIDTYEEQSKYDVETDGILTRFQLLKRGEGRSKNLKIQEHDTWRSRSGLCFSQLGDGFETCPKCFNEYKNLPIVGNIKHENTVDLFKKDCKYRGPECDGCELLT